MLTSKDFATVSSIYRVVELPWIARNENGELWGFSEKPKKGNHAWTGEGATKLNEKLLESVTWGCKDPVDVLRELEQKPIPARLGGNGNMAMAINNLKELFWYDDQKIAFLKDCKPSMIFSRITLRPEAVVLTGTIGSVMRITGKGIEWSFCDGVTKEPLELIVPALKLKRFL